MKFASIVLVLGLALYGSSALAQSGGGSGGGALQAVRPVIPSEVHHPAPPPAAGHLDQAQR